MGKGKIGVVGCGAISGIYLKNLTSSFENTEVLAVCDMDMEKAREKAKEYGISKVYTLDEMLDDNEIEIILNLTTPHVHYSIAKKALLKGKHVHIEKPLTVELDEGKELVEIAEKNNLLLGCAPDTFLGAGIMSSLELINNGAIGTPVAATAFMMCHGHESWHPDPEFYYKKGGGPMFDMGPYYLTALVNLIGPVKSLTAMTKKTFAQRTITSAKKNGTVMEVEVPTHINGVMEFHNGAIGNIITSFDVWGANLPCIEIHGTEGSISVPDPNGFGGKILLKAKGTKEWTEMPHTTGSPENMRGIGVSDMVLALKEKRINKCNGKMAYHVLELMHGFHIAAENRKHYEVKSTF